MISFPFPLSPKPPSPDAAPKTPPQAGPPKAHPTPATPASGSTPPAGQAAPRLDPGVKRA